MTTDERIATLNPRYKRAVKALAAPKGATVEKLSKVLKMDERPARLVVDRLRRKGLTVENVGPCRFKLVTGEVVEKSKK